jgi:hypothetical protein
MQFNINREFLKENVANGLIMFLLAIMVILVPNGMGTKRNQTSEPVVPSSIGNVREATQTDSGTGEQGMQVASLEPGNAALMIVMASLMGWIVLGVVLRPAIVQAARSLPPEALEVLMTSVNASIQIASSAALKTPTVLDDAVVSELASMITALQREISQKPKTPP